jgi:hypothetical protein
MKWMTGFILSFVCLIPCSPQTSAQGPPNDPGISLTKVVAQPMGMPGSYSFKGEGAMRLLPGSWTTKHYMRVSGNGRFVDSPLTYAMTNPTTWISNNGMWGKGAHNIQVFLELTDTTNPNNKINYASGVIQQTIP